MPLKTSQAKRTNPREPTTQDPINLNNEPQVEVEDHTELEEQEDATYEGLA